MSFYDGGISKERKKALLAFQKEAGFFLRDVGLLNLAFCHRSYDNERGAKKLNNERLEFLGDAALGLAVASRLYELFSDKPEGELAKIKSVVVSEDTLADIALAIGIDSLLILGKGEERSGGRAKKAILADAVEAVIGAVYLDGGFDAADDFVLRLIDDEIKKVVENRHKKDYKTALQEFFQKNFKTCPRYELVDCFGPDHDKTFLVEVVIANDKRYGPASGKSKKEAEQAAAKIACEAVLTNANE